MYMYIWDVESGIGLFGYRFSDWVVGVNILGLGSWAIALGSGFWGYRFGIVSLGI